MTTERLLQVEDVAARLSISTKTVRRLIAAGKLRAIRLGRRALRVSEADLQAYLAGTTNRPPGALTIVEACVELQVSRETVRRWIGQGRLKAVLHGDELLIPPEQIDGVRS